MNIGNFSRRAAVCGALLVAAVTLSACAEGARPQSMALTAQAGAPVASIAPTDPGYKAFRIAHVDGGNKTNPMWMSSVSSEDFQNALESSLKALGFLSDDPGAAKAEITANLQELKQPMIGLDLSVTSKVHYSAKATSGQKIIFDDTVAATGTAKFGDAVIAVKRLQLANEAAMKENIKAFIDRLRQSLSATTFAQN